jgi:hypothetical protein
MTKGMVELLGCVEVASVALWHSLWEPEHVQVLRREGHRSIVILEKRASNGKASNYA